MKRTSAVTPSGGTGCVPGVAGAEDAQPSCAGGRASHVIRDYLVLAVAVVVGLAVGLGALLGVLELLNLT